MVHGALRLGCRVVPRQQRTAAWATPILWAWYLPCGYVDGARPRPIVRKEVPDGRGSKQLPVSRRLDDYPCCNPCVAEASQRRCKPNEPVPLWHSTQRISQFDRVPGRLRLRWLASQHPGPLPLPLFLKLRRLLQRAGGPCDSRLHSQRPLARSHASWMTAPENSKPAAIRIL
jgi:hypothetical protein